MSKTYKEFTKISETITDKDTAINEFILNAINKLESMFEYKGLPETIPQKWLEYYLMCNGNVFITKDKDNLYAFVGGVGGFPDVYYQPTEYIVSNPYLKLNKSYDINKDGVLIRNDSLMEGMLPILKKYGTLLVECNLTIRCALINMRIVNTISANDDNTKKSADEYMKQIENGVLSVIGENPFFEGVTVHQNSNLSGYLNQLIEITQYIKASFYNEIGLNANYNLKREYISTTENSLADDILLPLCDNMLKERKEGVERVNEMFGTNITVEFNSSWKANNSQNEKEIADNEKEMKEGVENVNGETKTESSGTADGRMAENRADESEAVEERTETE